MSHAQELIDFHKALVAGGLPADVAGVCTIDLNKAYAAGTAKPSPTTKQEQQDAAAAASAEKAERRRQELEALEQP